MASSFADDLARYGPDAKYPVPSRAAARAYCRAFARRQYENFSVATLFLPRRLLPHFYHVYSYCRWADDLGDETGGGARTLDLLRWWRSELLRMYEGTPRHPVMVALQETVAHFCIPPQPFLDLLFAFEQDQLVKRYSTYEQLLHYCRHSANPVGHLVLYLFESFDPERASFADDICTALQLTNFWQDVARDFVIGRVYLPEEDMRRFGYAEAHLQARRFTPAFARLMRFQIKRTRGLFQRGEPLIGRVPRPVQLDLELFIRGGLAVLGKIERQGYNVWRRRPRLAKWEKAALIAGAVWRRLIRPNS